MYDGMSAAQLPLRRNNDDISNIPEISIDSREAIGKLRDVTTDDAAAKLEALGNPTRLALYRLLVRAGHPGLPVGQCQQRLGIAASTLSHHLKSLIIVGLVSQERDGTTLICRANFELMDTLVAFLVAECCVDAACVASEADAAVNEVVES